MYCDAAYYEPLWMKATQNCVGVFIVVFVSFTLVSYRMSGNEWTTHTRVATVAHNFGFLVECVVSLPFVCLSYTKKRSGWVT